MSHRLPAWVRILFVLLFTFAGALPVAGATNSAAAQPAGRAQSLPAAAVQGLAEPLAPAPLPRVARTAVVPPAGQETEPAPLALALSVEPPLADPGAAVTFTVAIANPGQDSAQALTLSAALVEGLTFLPGEADEFTYDPARRLLGLTMPELLPGGARRAAFQARLGELRPGTLITQTIALSWSGAAEPLLAETHLTVAAPPADESWIEPAGGWLRSLDGRVTLRFPPGAVAGRTRVRYAAAEAPVSYAGLRYTFSLDAADEAGRAVSTFSAPVTLTYRPAEGVVDDRSERPLYGERSLYLWDEAAARWTGLAVTRDTAGTLQVELPHFSIYSDGSINYVAEQIATVRGAQTTLFTRAVGYGVDFDLPPGRGGMTPRLGLGYQSAGHVPDIGHFSLTGYGWQLSGADSIYTPPGDANLGKPILTLQGVSYSLRQTGDGN